MHVVEWLIANNMDWDLLKAEFGIKVRHYPEEDLHVLNYCQIESPKTHPIVKECRGLILDYDLNIMARPFDRFFNRGEADTAQYEGQTLKWFQKRDGTFIQIYMSQGKWHAATRSMAFAEGGVAFDDNLTFKKLVYRALHISTDAEFQTRCKDSGFIPGKTYMFELTARENRVVTRYETPRMSFLAARDNLTGEYLNYSGTLAKMSLCFDAVQFWEGTPEEAVASADNLKNLEEGYVGYTAEGYPVVKVKSAAYVAVHHLRGEGLNPKRISELVATGEQDEYLAYFPEDRQYIQPYVDAEYKMIVNCQNGYDIHKEIQDQKAFALQVKNIRHHTLMFLARRNGTDIEKAYKCLPQNTRAKMIQEEKAYFSGE